VRGGKHNVLRNGGLGLWLVVPIVLAVMLLLPMLPNTKGGIRSIYDAGMFAVYNIVLAWGL
jgi:hypothetical protein